jgi:signal transduction histidine kinase/ligand-binding sensor domain-containing protein
MRFYRLLLVALCCSLMGIVHASQPADGNSYEHRRWTRTEGAPQLAFAMAQTADGMMWFGTPDGLYSFDGVRFNIVSSLWGNKLSATNVSSLLAIPDGLIVGYRFGGLSIFTKTSVTHYVAGKDFPQGSTVAIVTRHSVEFYAATSTTIVQLVGKRWLPIQQDSLPQKALVNIDFDKEDTLWASFAEALYAKRSGEQAFKLIASPSPQGASKVNGQLYAIAPAGGYLALSATMPPHRLKLDAPSLYTGDLMQGPDNSLWGARTDGIARLGRQADGTLYSIEHFGPGRGTSGRVINSLIDLEGNLWVASLDGIERFRKHRLHQLNVDDKAQSLNWLARPGLGDELWYGALDTPVIRRLPDGRRQSTEVSSPTSIYRASSDHVWVGAQGVLWEFSGGGTHRWALPAQLARFPIQAITSGPRGEILVSIVRSGLWRFKEGSWTQDAMAVIDPTPISMLTDSKGQTWLGLTNNRLGQLTSAGVQFLPASANLNIGNVTSIYEDAGRLLVGGDLGLAWLDGGKVKEMAPDGGDSFRGVSGIVADRKGNLWLHASAGLIRITAQALERFWLAPNQPLQWEVFNYEDGLRGTSAKIRPLPSIALGADGNIYYATMEGVGWIDPDNIRRNKIAPQVIFETVSANGRQYRAVSGLALPERTTTLDIRFTAASLSIPERVRLRYKLDTVDADWRDASQDRAAHYTNLAPGHYRFHVTAANEDGLWSKETAEFSFSIAPALWQTTWFKVLGVGVLLLVLFLLHRWRIAAVTRRSELRASIRLDGMLNERIRIARSLHDNLLQGMQALIMRCQSVLTRLPADAESRRLLDGTLDYAEKLLDETRDEVMALRREPRGDQILGQLHHALVTSLPDTEDRLQFSMSGEPQTVRSEVASEIIYVLREAVLNSARHANATVIAVSLNFGYRFVECEVRDNGVGIDAAIAEAGKDGHWGVLGMRERVASIGGEISIGRGQEGGVVVRLRIPAVVAYQKPHYPTQG